MRSALNMRVLIVKSVRAYCFYCLINIDSFTTDSDYKRFVESLQNPESDAPVSLDSYLEELEEKERLQKGVDKYSIFLYSSNTCAITTDRSK